jgi:hypothetical protein
MREALRQHLRSLLGLANDEPSPADPSPAQHRAAADPVLMQGVFQRHLQTLDGKACQVRECQVTHASYVQATHRYKLQYTLRLAEPDTGREWSQLVSGIIYAGGRTRQVWNQLQGSNLIPNPPYPSPTLAAFHYISGLDMLVQVFPYDHRLPALSLLMAGPPPDLEPLLSARFGPGEWKIEAWEAEPVRYYVALRATLRVTMHVRDAATGQAEELRCYVKVYANKKQGHKTYRVLQALWDKASVGSAGFTVGRPIAYLDTLGTLIQEEFSGTSLLEEVLLQEHEIVPVMSKAARALAALHLDQMILPRRRRRLKNVIGHLERKGNLLQQACPHLRSEIEEVVRTIVAGLAEAPPAPTHCDLGMAHILLSDERLALVDLDAFARSDPILDVANILSQLFVLPFRYPLSREVTRAAASTFAEEYFVYVPEPWRTRLPFHYAGALLRRAHPDTIDAVLGEAKDSLAGAIR